ncbi:MAG TPA: ribosome-associated translation inhibitor RaiA [Phycisphaerales bacterium]|nr:ribosome-associated translation inhibitor RaiA [Phycisphaerales bacterium]
MRVDVVGFKLEVTDAIRAHAETKAGKLPKFFDGTQQVTFRLTALGPGHGGFEVEVVVDVEKHDDFVAKATGDDLYLTIDSAVHKVTRQLTTFKEKLKQSGHHPR